MKPKVLTSLLALLVLLAACSSNVNPTPPSSTRVGSNPVTPDGNVTSAPSATRADFPTPTAINQPTAANAGTLVTVAQPMKVARATHTSTLLNNGQVLITGGLERNDVILNSAELFDYIRAAFTVTGPMQVKRAAHTATLLPNGKVLIIGGSGPASLTSAELYDPTTATFTLTGSMASPRSGHTATLLTNGKVLVTGGTTFDGSQQPIIANAEIYDPVSGTFAGTGSLSSPRVAHSATLLNNGQVLIVGGAKGRYPNQTLFTSAELYDPAVGTFTLTLGSMSIVRHKHAAILLTDGKVLITGGSDNRDWNGRYMSAEIYDPTTATFTATSKMSVGRFKLMDSTAVLPNGQVLIAGGAQSIEVYDPSSRSFKVSIGTLDTARFFMTATTLPNGKVLLAGGYNQGSGSNGPLSTAEAWVFQP